MGFGSFEWKRQSECYWQHCSNNAAVEKNSVGGCCWLIQCPVHYVTLSHRVLLGCCAFFSHQTSLKKDLCGGFKNTSSNLNEIILFFSKDFAKLCDETKQSHSASILIKLFYPSFDHTFPVGEMQNRVAEFCYCFCLYKRTHSFNSPLVARKSTRVGQVLE